MDRSKKQLLRMCRNFFLTTIFFTAFLIWGLFYAYHIYKIFGLILMLFASSGILPYFYKNTYFILEDIFKMNIDMFEGKIGHIIHSDILPYRIMIVNKKDKRKSGLYHLNIKKKKHIPHGSWVKITYLKKSEIIVSFEVIKHKKDGTINNYSALSQSP